MSVFVFESYEFEPGTGLARFRYSFTEDKSATFCEELSFGAAEEYDQQVMERALFLAFMLIGVSYYKTAPTQQVLIRTGGLDEWQAEFFSRFYQEGLSQFAFENNLTRAELAQFTAHGDSASPVSYKGAGVLSLQSGGKDSLLVARMLEEAGRDFSGFYVSSTGSAPDVISHLGGELLIAKRTIDHAALRRVGGLNGHVPVTYIVLAISLIQAVLSGKNVVLAGIGHEGEEPHEWIGDLPVNHQWSKTWQAEQLFAEYVERYISPDIRVGSPLRAYTELKVSKHFVELGWSRYAGSFSSCNVANYRQGASNETLTWCGECPKCANSYLLFSPFVSAKELIAIFGCDLYTKLELAETFKGLLGIDGVMKPFECVGEIDELRYAYHQAQNRGHYAALPFEVPRAGSFDIDRQYPSADFSDLFA